MQQEVTTVADDVMNARQRSAHFKVKIKFVFLSAAICCDITFSHNQPFRLRPCATLSFLWNDGGDGAAVVSDGPSVSPPANTDAHRIH